MAGSNPSEAPEQFNPYISTQPLNLKQIRQFVVLAETLNYRVTAEKLHMAQPPLTVSIRKLEDDLGTKLFHRDNKGVTLTASGKALLPEAHKLLFYSDHFRKLTRNLIEGAGGPLRIGFVYSATYGLLQTLVEAFKESHPQIRLTLRELNSSVIIDQLQDQTLDVGLVRTPLMRPSAAKLQTLQTDHLVLAIARDSELSARSQLRLADLSEYPFVMYGPVLAPGLHATAMLACERAGFIPRIAEHGAQIQTLLALVEGGMGIALVPSVTRRFASPEIVFRELDDLTSASETSLALAYLPDNHNPAIMHFREVAEAAGDRGRSLASADWTPGDTIEV